MWKQSGVITSICWLIVLESCGPLPESPASPTLTLANQTITPVSSIAPSPTTAPKTPTSPADDNWQTFTNESYRYAFSYPDSVELVVGDKDLGRVEVRTGEDEAFLLEAQMDFLPGDAIFYLDTESTGQRQLGGYIWKEYFLPEGYCDGPNCTPPIYALQMTCTGILYQVTIYALESTTETQEEILATFRVIQ